MRTGVHPGRWSARRAAPLALAALLAPAIAPGARAQAGAARRPDAAMLEIGQRIYREGMLPSGGPLKGAAQAGVERAGPDAACEGCHRRSGYGTSEGPIAIRSITGPSLFGWREAAPAAAFAATPPGMVPATPGVAARAARVAARRAGIAARTGSRRRPPYDEVSLARAIRDGVDVTGRLLGAGMPRYALGDDEMKALVAYLQTLSTEPSPGVTGEEIHFATVVQPGVEPAKRGAMLDVLQGFVRDKNAGTRSEAQRREVGIKRMQRAYRRWVLHVWDLTGPAAAWGRQLETLYARQPVFALIGGLGTTSWRPVHDFSERLGVPCLFPQVDLPVISDAGFYTVYLSRGISLEAEALAKFLHDRGRGGPVTQVFGREESSAAAAAALRAAMPAEAGVRLGDRVLDGSPTRAFWERLARESAGSTLVLWLPAPDLAEAAALTEAGSPVEAVYLSATLLGGGREGLAAGGDGRVRMVYPLDLPRSRGARLLRVRRWLHERGIALSDEKVQMNAYFAVTVTADVVAHMTDLFSREYLVERVEHAVGNTVTPSLYPRVSLGPGQRFASKGSFIVKVGGRDAGELEPLSGWITP
jgi:cytochrome c553